MRGGLVGLQRLPVPACRIREDARVSPTPAPSPADVAATTDEVAQSATRLLETLAAALPRVGIALALVAVGWLVSRAVRMLLRRLFLRNQPPSFARVMSRLVGWLVVVLSVLFALAVTFPSVQPVDVLAGLGFFSVAAGFAFQDVLKNLLAGLLLLFRQPFAGGDQVRLLDHEGVVEQITIRETVLRTFDGRRVLIPNSDVSQNPLVIDTAFRWRRSSFVVGVAYEADLSVALDAVLRGLRGVDGVMADPAPEAILVELGPATVDIEARFWSAPRQPEVLAVQTRAIHAVKTALEDAGVEMPSEIIALQATASFAAALRGEQVTPGGNVAPR